MSTLFRRTLSLQVSIVSNECTSLNKYERELQDHLRTASRLCLIPLNLSLRTYLVSFLHHWSCSPLLCTWYDSGLISYFVYFLRSLGIICTIRHSGNLWLSTLQSLQRSTYRFVKVITRTMLPKTIAFKLSHPVFDKSSIQEK